MVDEGRTNKEEMLTLLSPLIESDQTLKDIIQKVITSNVQEETPYSFSLTRILALIYYHKTHQRATIGELMAFLIRYNASFLLKPLMKDYTTLKKQYQLPIDDIIYQNAEDYTNLKREVMSEV